MTICPCPCHQNIKEKSNCGDCGNTGILIDQTKANPTTFISTAQRAIFPKGETNVANVKPTPLAV